MTRQMFYDGNARGWYVIVETYCGVEYCAFFWKAMDAENWHPERFQ